jgi:hypothetical protein
MTARQITTSAALFGSNIHTEPISLTWLARSQKWMQELTLSPILFSGSGADDLLDGCYVLTGKEGDIFQSGEIIADRAGALECALREGRIEYLGIDSPRPGARDRSDWCASAMISQRDCEAYQGADEHLVADPVTFLRQAYERVRDQLDVRYGFAYKMLLADLPDCYAGGTRRTTMADLREVFRRQRERMVQTKTADDLWHDEIHGRRRYLTGLFRDAYPANILNSAHVQRAGLQSAALGELTQLSAGLWLWALTNEEVSTAKALLETKKLLVSQQET